MSTERLSAEEAEALEVAEFRERFFAEKRPQIESGKYDVRDVRRLRTDTSWVMQFLHRCDSDLDVAVPIMAESLKWRHDFGVNNISVLDLRPLLERQEMYMHGHDKNNVPLLWFNVRNQKKDEDRIRSLIVYWLEKHNREAKGDPVVIVFDMSSTGLQNMDLDLIKFLLNCLKFHYPGLLDYLLVFNIPWVLSAAWKVVGDYTFSMYGGD